MKVRGINKCPSMEYTSTSSEGVMKSIFGSNRVIALLLSSTPWGCSPGSTLGICALRDGASTAGTRWIKRKTSRSSHGRQASGREEARGAAAIPRPEGLGGLARYRGTGSQVGDSEKREGCSCYRIVVPGIMLFFYCLMRSGKLLYLV